MSPQARLWLDHLQIFPNLPSFFHAVLPDSQPHIQRQSRHGCDKAPSSSQNSIANLYTLYRQDIQKSTSSRPAALRKCPVGAIKTRNWNSLNSMESLLYFSSLEKLSQHKKWAVNLIHGRVRCNPCHEIGTVIKNTHTHDHLKHLELFRHLWSSKSHLETYTRTIMFLTTGFMATRDNSPNVVFLTFRDSKNMQMKYWIPRIHSDLLHFDSVCP